VPRPPVSQPQIQHREIGSVKLAKCDAFRYGTRDSAYLIACVEQRLFEHVGHQEIFFGNHDREHDFELQIQVEPETRSPTSASAGRVGNKFEYTGDNRMPFGRTQAHNFCVYETAPSAAMLSSQYFVSSAAALDLATYDAP
jgi:hypothetical protein